MARPPNRLRRRLQLTAQRVRFPLVQHQQRGKPPIKQRIFRQVVRIGGPLQQLDLRQHFKLFPPLVKVDQSLLQGVRNGSMNHGQISQERPEVRDRAVADEGVLFLEHFLQVAIVLTDRVGKLGSSFAHQDLPLGPRVVILGEYPGQLGVQLELFPWHYGPGFGQPVDGVRLETRDDRFEGGEVLQQSQLLGDVDPG